MGNESKRSRCKWGLVVGVVATLCAGAALGAGVFYLLRHLESTSGDAEAATRHAPSASDLLYVFHRPAEPIFTLRGHDRNVAFDVPVSYLPARYVSLAAEIRDSAARGPGRRLIQVPDLPMPAERFADINGILPFRSPFTRSAPIYLRLVIRFWHFFQESKSVPELLARAVWARLHYNPEMILDALMLAMLRSPFEAVKDVQLPELPQYIPELYTDDEFFAKAREEMHLVAEKDRVAVPVVRNLAKDDEAVLWYFREDVHFHVFHWKWHVVYPAGSDDDEYVDLPRRGELFVHLHRQFTARYNAERFTNGLPAVLPMDVHEPLPKGYFPKMVHLHGEKGTIGRQANTSLLPLAKFIQNHDSQRALYDQVLKQGYVTYSNGTRVNLVGIEGLDIISNLLEGNSLLSPNYDYYGNVHNDLHANLAFAADPLHEYKESFALTSYITTVAKDPAFFNIHQLMDDLYEKYKIKLAPYSTDEVTPLPAVTLQSVSVRTAGLSQDNALRTYMQQTDLDVSMGLDYTPPGRQYARFTHLQHRRFDYVLQVLNNESQDRKVFVRLFLLMTEDENGSPLDLDFQRRFSMQLDTFEATLSPGANTVRRSSVDSALTIDNDAIYTPQPSVAEIRRRNACRCGWPSGLLLPRGSPAGTPYKLLAMVTDFAQDRAPKAASEQCSDGWLLCGVPGSTHYPDVRAMGFPLDRPFRAAVKTLGDFLTPNMAVADVVVQFENTTEPPTALLPGGASTSWMP
ncbi:phenoloxidase 2-like isoform X2 [Thrips palmi]|uniref:Phenoloxidase 2-like isoform X2 n=1 Tax=Thrips palmi TaxID=161013 RepID=A0A6P8ZA87_THRPL|nr:phenoloxidase 2-like isoform X2 [Thrips palmi]